MSDATSGPIRRIIRPDGRRFDRCRETGMLVDRAVHRAMASCTTAGGRLRVAGLWFSGLNQGEMPSYEVSLIREW